MPALRLASGAVEEVVSTGHRIAVLTGLPFPPGESGNADLPGDLTVGLPVGLLAGQERIIRGRLDLAILAMAREVTVCSPGAGAPQSRVQKLQAYSSPSPSVRVALCHGLVVDADLDPGDGCSPRRLP